MPKLRRLNGRQVVSILEDFGFEVVRIRGSHHNMRRIVNDQNQNLNVPVHGNKDLATGTLRSIYRQALDFISEDELRRHFYTD
jgi:predicted RNA binding protein YcfA (HicA-like mRNA interferase family)